MCEVDEYSRENDVDLQIGERQYEHYKQRDDGKYRV